MASKGLRRGNGDRGTCTTVRVRWRRCHRAAHSDIGAIPSKDVFIREASAVPAYKNSADVARFILLAAYHDAVAEPGDTGLIVKGKRAVSPCLTYDGFRDDRNLSLEHIAPQDQSSSNTWDAAIYANKEIVHRLGNLVFVPKVANSSLSSRPWQQKRVLYKALGAASHSDAEKVLVEAKSNEGVEFGDSTQEIVSSSKHLPQVAALGSHASNWDTGFIEYRSARILGLAWDELQSWLQ